MRIDRFKLVEKMMKRNLNQKQLSYHAKVSRATISGIKAGRSCSEAVGVRIADALGVDVTEIIEK